MHFNNHARHLAFALSLFPFFGLSTTKVVETTATALKPININDFEAATGVQRRAAVDFSRLDPSTQAQLIYGRPGSKYCYTALGALPAPSTSLLR